MTRRASFRSKLLLALLGPFAVLLLAEVFLRITNLVPAQSFFLERTGAGGEAELAVNPGSPWNELPFEPQRFPRHKAGDTFRIFCIGDSTTKGTPFASQSAPAKWLSVRLQALHPGRRFEVVKMGFDAKPALKLADLCAEVVRYEPDLIVVYTGHNEFLAHNFDSVKRSALTRWRERFLKLRLGQLILSFLSKPQPGEPLFIKNPPRQIADEPALAADELAQGYDNFRTGLEAMMSACRERGVTLVLCLPTSNLRDFPPRASAFAAHVSSADRAAFRATLRDGEALLEERQFAHALARFESLRALDDSPALLHYRLAQCHDGLGDRARAHAEYAVARNADNHPNRATAEHWRLIRAAAGSDAIVVDCEASFARACTTGLPGYDLFVDNCHPTVDAQNLIADAILHALAERGVMAPASEWHFEREPDRHEYYRRMQIDLPGLTRDFASHAIFNLVYLLDAADPVEPIDQAERLLLAARGYDQDSACVHLGLALVAALRGDLSEGRRHLAACRAREPELVPPLLASARGRARVARALQDLLGTEGGAPPAPAR